jgi:molecular chaperone DnaK
MVGGSSRIPLLIEAMKQEFGTEKVLLHERPMLAIAEGAAILSHRLAEAYECPKCGVTVGQTDTLCKNCGFDLEKHTIEEGLLDIVHSAAHDYFIHLENNDKYLFIEKNTPLPCERTEVFKLVHPEQKLIHMKFANVVNDIEESIGDLWLGIDLDKKEENAAGEKAEPLRVAITLRIDENNLIEVEARLKEYPEVSLSKTLSRGKADEKVFRSLEGLINEANRAQYNSYIMTDILYRALSIIKDAHEVIDPATDEVDQPAFNRATMKIEKAKRLAAENKVSKATIFYARSVVDDYGFALAPDKQEKIKKCVTHLEKMDEYGTYEENIQAIAALQKEFKDLGLVQHLIEIEKAAEFSETTDPGKATRFYRAIEDITIAVSKADMGKITKILDEIMPQAWEVVDANEAVSATIHKNISR